LIVVPYAVGAATPSQAALAADQRGHYVVFTVDAADTEAMSHLPLLEAFGPALVCADAADALAQVRALAERPAAVVAFADTVIPTAALIAERFDLPGHRPAIAPMLVDKAAQRRRLNSRAVSHVATATLVVGEVAPSYLPLPGVLKPAQSAGSRDTHFVDTADDVRAALAGCRPGERFVVERRIDGVPLDEWLAGYVSVESVVSAAGVSHLGVTGRLPLAAPARERGLIFPIALDAEREAELTALAERAIAAVDVQSGLVHTEIMLGAAGPEVIELNARLGGGLATIVPAAGGCDPVGLALDLALGRTPATAVAQQVAAHLYLQPPIEATRLISAPDRREIRELPGVIGVDQRLQVGAASQWRVGSAGRAFDVFVRAATLPELRARIAAVESFAARRLEWAS
jgi:biotin carboxylase